MKVPKLKVRKLWIIAAFGLVLICGLVYYFLIYVRPGSTKYLNSTLGAQETKKNLEDGNCSDTTKQKLANIDESSDPSAIAKAYEARGLCLVYSNDLEGAKAAYEKSAEFYGKANDTEKKQELESVAQSVTRLLNGQKAQQQQMPEGQ